MALNEFTVEDYLEQARSRVTFQFTDKVVFDKYLQLLILESVSIQETLKDLMQNRSLDTAVGAQLDILGNIVGQDRVLFNVDILEFFGFLGVPNAGSFGDLDNTSVGAVMYDINNPKYGNIRLTDEMYRLFIKAKIVKNITSATPEEIMFFANFIFGSSQSTVQEEGGAAYTLYVGKELNGLERSLLRYVDPNGIPFFPKPVGVRVNYGEFDAERFFAFADVPGAKGFGDFSNAVFDGSYVFNGAIKYLGDLRADVGGKLASLIV